MKVISILFLISTIQVYGVCHKPKVDFYFANGMFNDWTSARQSLEILKKRIAGHYPEDTYNHYEVAYNTNEFVLLQLLQVYRHKMEDGTISFWKWLGNFANFKDSKVFQEQFDKIFSAQSVKDRDLQKQIQRYQRSINENFSVVTVAHSQGNFYTNFAFEKLGLSNTKMISVATPANSVYGDGSYFTFKSDGVIAYVPSALPPNRKRSTAGLFDHEFIKHYLDDSATGAEILSAIHESYEQLNASSEDEMNADLDGVMAWHERNSKQKRSDRMSDCLLSYAIYKLKAANLTCKEKNFSKIL